MRRYDATLLLGLLLVSKNLAVAQTTNTPIPRPGFEITLWAREPMLRSPVALSFDDWGRLYVVETARRGSVDIDIRAHQEWLVGDLSNQTVDDLRRFFRSKMSPEKSRENASWLRDYNGDGSHDWRDLMEVKERVHRLEDTKGTGQADRAQVFAEGFNEEISGVLAGVLAWGKDVLVTVYPDLWRLQDKDGDGVADTQESLFRGFGVHAAFDGHDLHGLTVGPEGKIYFSVGDNGFSVVNKQGRRLHHPNTGSVLRMNPDGTDLEVFATGLRNVQELAFDEFGNLFSVDNDGDLEDERERFVYIVEGSDSGWRINWQFREPGWAKFTGQPNYNPWIADRMWVPHFTGQPAHITPPLSNYSVGPSGFKYNPGTALNSAYRQHFFLVQFPVQKITAFQVKPKGAFFEMVNEHLFLSGMMASSLNFSPNGAMFIADWDGLWTPNGKGAIWALDDPKAAGSSVRQEVKRLLAEGMEKRSAGDLMSFLGHEDMRIRQRAQFELVRRGDQQSLLEMVRQQPAPQLARVHALWGLSQLRREVRPDELPFNDADFEIRAQSAKVAGDLRLRSATPALVNLLADASPRVRFHAALALGKTTDVSALPALAQLLADNADQYPFIRHACVMGLAGIGKSDALAQFVSHSSPSVRMGVVVALRRLKASSVAAFLHDSDPLVRNEAVRAIHDDSSIPEAMPALAALLDEPNLTENEGIVRRAINANLRLGQEQNAQRLSHYATVPSRPELLRIEALESMAAWNHRPFLDRVEGMVRPLSHRPAALGDQLIKENFLALLKSAGKTMAEALTRIMMRNGIETDPELFANWVTSTNQPLPLRTQSLQFLAQRRSDRLPSVLQFALVAEEPELRITAMKILADVNTEEFMSFIESRGDRLSLQEKQTTLSVAARLKGAKAASLIGKMLDQYLSGQLPQELALDVLEASRRSEAAEIKSRLATYEASLVGKDLLTKYRPALYGGDPAAGREIFRNHVAAQCVRCHEAGGEGYQAGPVLAGIGGRQTREYLLESLVNPSARLAQWFETVTLVRRDGEVFDGTKLKETDAEISLRLQSGEIRKLARKDIERQTASSVSSMPPMAEVLTPLEIRDLVAYLATLQ